MSNTKSKQNRKQTPATKIPGSRRQKAEKAGVDQKPFRLNAFRLGATWSCPVTAEDNPIKDVHRILAFLQDKYGEAEKYIVAEEKHENGKRHYHAFFHFYNKLDVRDARAFDIDGVHPNIIRCPGKGWPDYCAKKGQFITNYWKQPLLKRVQDMSVPQALDTIAEENPQYYVTNLTRIEANLKRHKERKKRCIVRYKADMFTLPLITDFRYSIFVRGPSDIGKSNWCLAHFQNPCMVRGEESAKQYDPTIHDGIVFDDVDSLFFKLSRTEKIALIDTDFDSELSCRFKNVVIPAGTPRFFTTNSDFELLFGRLLEDYAIVRRCLFINIRRDIRKKC